MLHWDLNCVPDLHCTPLHWITTCTYTCTIYTLSLTHVPSLRRFRGFTHQLDNTAVTALLSSPCGSARARHSRRRTRLLRTLTVPPPFASSFDLQILPPAPATGDGYTPRHRRTTPQDLAVCDFKFTSFWLRSPAFYHALRFHCGALCTAGYLSFTLGIGYTSGSAPVHLHFCTLGGHAHRFSHHGLHHCGIVPGLHFTPAARILGSGFARHCTCTLWMLPHRTTVLRTVLCTLQ